MSDKLDEIAAAFFPESAERFSRCRAAVGRAYDLGRADWDKERERADDHDSARQSEKERADYAEAKLAEAQARAQRFHETIMSELEVRKRLETELATAREEVKFHHDALVRVAEAVGVTEPLQLIALAENNDENYVDLLVKHITAARERERVLREALSGWVPPHSAACCTPDPGSGTFPAGPLKPDWCRCSEMAKRARAALRGEGEK